MEIKEKLESVATVKRVGLVIKLRSEYVQQYLSLHTDSSPGVRDLLTKYHLTNFSIFLHMIGGEYFEFGYYEYTGISFESDMEALAGERRNIEWLQVCDPMQIPLEGETGWTIMQPIFYNKGFG